MIIKSIDFYGSVVEPKGYPTDQLPQIILAGRSNVGKSSFINAMLNNHKVARVAKTPGKTRLLNFFLINKSFYFVDVPGYGYAAVGKGQLNQFHKMIETYLEKSQAIRLACLLLDMRHDPTQDDWKMIEYLTKRSVPTLILLTKSDKLSGNGKAQQLKQFKTLFPFINPNYLIPFSSETKKEVAHVWEVIESIIPELQANISE